MVKIQIFETNQEHFFFFFFLALYSRFIEKYIIPISPEYKIKKIVENNTNTHDGHEHKQTPPPLSVPH